MPIGARKPEPPRKPGPLYCEECGEQAAGGARGWRGYRIDDPEDGDPPEIGFFCPDCAYREFGPLLDRYDSAE